MEIWERFPGVAADDFQGIIGMDLRRGGSLATFCRTTAGIQFSTHAGDLWIVVRARDQNLVEQPHTYEILEGSGALNRLCRLNAFNAWSTTRRRLQHEDVPHIAPGSPVKLHLMSTGITSFRRMEPTDIVRLQLDIETTGLDPQVSDARIILIACSINGDHPTTIGGTDVSEREAIDSLTRLIQDVDPDVIEGHNIFNFDIPYLAARAARLGCSLAWGRDGSLIRTGVFGTCKIGPRSIPFDNARIYGRHIIDTYHQVQRFDVSGKLRSYALKDAVSALGLRESSRTFIDRRSVSKLAQMDPERLRTYAIDDVLDTYYLSELTFSTEFFQAQLLPDTLQNIAIQGTGEKVNDMLIRAYLRDGTSIPVPGETRPYPGGYTEVRRSGRFSPIAHVDVESLYPSLMIDQSIAPDSDERGYFLPMLQRLTERRLEAKRRLSSEPSATRATMNGRQQSLKVLINSFFGYLGYNRGYFNDVNAAERITLSGQEVIQQIAAEIEDRDCRVVQIDTDGIYFSPGDSDSTQGGSIAQEVNDMLPDALNLAYTGAWSAMLSLRIKNYVLLGDNGELEFHGSAMRNRRDEPFIASFIERTARSFIDEEFTRTPQEVYLNMARRIIDRDFQAAFLARTESITRNTFSSQSPANRALASISQGLRVGDRLQVYRRSSGALARVDDYEDDPDIDYYLRRLHASAARFQPLFDSQARFEHEFPLVRSTDDLDAFSSMEFHDQTRLF